jgi:hypothetical protein
MKTRVLNRRLTLAIVTSFVITGSIGVAQSQTYDEQGRRIVVRSTRHQSGGMARLVITRIPNLGNLVIVDLAIDGVSAGSIGYGQNYDAAIPAGRHVVSVVASPHPRYLTPWQLVLDARSGETYRFTAMSNSGQIILRSSALPVLTPTR